MSDETKAVQGLPKLLRRWGPPLLIAGAALAMIWTSWLKWPDVLVDYGQQPYVAWQLAEGKTLYQDVAYFHGPLSAYAHALLLRFYGTSLLTLFFFNLLLTVAVAFLLYRMLLALGSRVSATAGSLLFVTVFAFGQYLGVGNYNYVAPYTYEITHGMALALIALYGFDAYVRGRGRGALLVSGLALGLAFLTKAEIFLAAALALAAGLAVRRAPVRQLAIFAGGAVAGPLAAWILLAAASSPGTAIQGITKAYTSLVSSGASDLLFYRSRMGLDAPAVHLQRLAITITWHLAVLVPAALVALVRRRLQRTGLAVLLVAFLAVFLETHLQSSLWLQAGRPLPLYALAAVCLWGVAILGRHRDAGLPARFAFAVFALVLLVKIVLNSRVYHYGFVLAMPATVVLVLLWVDELPAWIERRGGSSAIFRTIVLGVLVLAAVAHVQVARGRFAAKDVLVADGGDAFWADRRGLAVQAVLDHLEREALPGETLLVVPDGILLNYLARMPTPAPYLNYVPTEVFAYGEERILADLKRRPPDHVVVVEKSTAEFGYRYFGQDYAREIGRFLDASYETVGGVGAEPLTGQGFGVRWMRKRSRRPRPRLRRPRTPG